MNIAKDFEKDVALFVWSELASLGKFELIDLLARAEKGDVKKVRVKRQLVPNIILHNTVIKFLTKHGVEVIRDDIRRG
jgi:hypothetical protein